MEEFVSKWAVVVGLFLGIGIFYQAVKMTVRAKAGDTGFKGVFYVWKRVLLLPLGCAAGAACALLGAAIPPFLGQGIGGGVLAGLLASAAAGLAYEQIIGTAKAMMRHKVAKAE